VLDESLAHATADLAREASNRSRRRRSWPRFARRPPCWKRRFRHSKSVAKRPSRRWRPRMPSLSRRRGNSAFRRSGSRTSRRRFPHEMRSWRGLRSRSPDSRRDGRAQEPSPGGRAKSAALTAARKLLEAQLAQQAQQREQLLSQRRDEHEQMRACIGKVNDLGSRVRARLAASDNQ